MTKSEIITELKQCKGNRAALEAAVKSIELSGCGSCKHRHADIHEYPCKECGRVNQPFHLWEAAE